MEKYSIQTCKKLEKQFQEAGLFRKMRYGRYDDGDELSYKIKTVVGAKETDVRLKIDKFVGGGFAGQVYRIKILKIGNGENAVDGLETGKLYAMKILIPPSGFSKIFRNAIYWLGFQGTFQLQVNPDASRAGAIWQKFIRRAAKIKFGDEKSVVDIYATLIDKNLGSCGEISEWIEGRNWQLEVDDHMDELKKWIRGKKVDESVLGSPEYRSKRIFMKEFVKLLHELGGYEFARQYEWSTCKSQPNCLKRMDTENEPEKGLVAVDFRAGLALLPFLPMSPGDFMLIGKGILRGSLVQFDRGSIPKLEKYIDAHREEFSDLIPLLKELKTDEGIYRNSVPDITHNFFKLFYSGKLWKTMLSSSRNGWEVQNLTDSNFSEKLKKKSFLNFLLFLIAFIPIFGKLFIKFVGNKNFRKHYGKMISSWKYLRASIRGNLAEKAIFWHRAGRIDEKSAENISHSVWKFLLHLPLSLLPVGLHKFFTNKEYFKNRLFFIFVRPIRLYFDEKMREEWLLEMLEEGKKKRILSEDDAQVIRSQLDEPFIQKYLKSLAVHVCTLPVTQVVSVIIALIYVFTHPEMPRAQAWGIGVGIIALFQVIPISPGSLVRGLYVLYLVIKERDFKNYNIAVFLGFFKYVGYLAFPIQMTYRYPALARFMAGHWATEAVHIVPVFGEHGALLEHWVFRLFYNWPLTTRRRMKEVAEYRKTLKARYWHLFPISGVVAVLLGIADYYFLHKTGNLPTMKTIWWAILTASLLSGVFTTIAAGGTALGKRIIASAFCGIFVGLFYTLITFLVFSNSDLQVGQMIIEGFWRIFVFGLFSTIFALITEIKFVSPKKVWN